MRKCYVDLGLLRVQIDMVVEEMRPTDMREGLLQLLCDIEQFARDETQVQFINKPDD